MHYYILNEGWIDENLVIYKKNFLFMDKMDFEESEKTFKDIDKITDEEAKAPLKSYFFRDSEVKPYQSLNESNLKNENPSEQEILKQFSLEDLKKIPNSNFGLVEVDRARTRSRRFFVEIKDAKLSFISEIPDTSPDINGEMNKEDVIILHTKDINGNEHFYESDDYGMTFRIVE